MSALSVMQAQAGTRAIGSFVTVNDTGSRFRITSHFRSFEEFAARVAYAAQFDKILDPVFNGTPCTDELVKMNILHI